MKLLKLFSYLILLYGPVSVAGQSLPEYGINKARIIFSDKEVVIEFNPVSAHVKAKSSLWYYWYEANIVHSSQGGFSGKLLNGAYEEFFLNKSLETQGHFKKGLKDGEWKQWDDMGRLIAIVHWKNGVQLTEDHTSFWKKLPMFKRKAQMPVSDTAKKSG